MQLIDYIEVSIKSIGLVNNTKMIKKFIFPLKMHIGRECLPIVKAGEEVKRGQCIADPNGLGAKIHTSVSGKVLEVTDKEIVIEAYSKQSEDYVKIKECENILESIYEAGIVGAGGAGFPTNIKLQPQVTPEYIIANCVECEPILNHNIKLLEEDPEVVIKGIDYSMKAINAKKAYIGIKAKNTKAIQRIKTVLKDFANIEIKELKDLYPVGEERALIYAVFGKWLTPTQLPLEANCIVLNCETLANITRAIEYRKPVIDKDITIAGKLNSDSKANVFFQIPVGTSIESLIQKCGGIDGKYGEIIIGGPYTGKSQKLENAVVTKISGGAILTIELPEYRGPLGLLVCACGADEERLRDIASKMQSEVVGVTKCKNIEEIKGSNKCKTPGECPGQAAGIMYLKKLGAKRVLISNCSDCSNTVMCCAPKMGLAVYHHTDHVFRTLDYPLTRRLKMDE